MTLNPKKLTRGLCVGLLALSGGIAGNALADVEMTIRADEPGDTISKYLYGQFAEHLGRGLYEGIWVGEDSDIPNTGGFRNDVIEALKPLKIPVIRWPGGCFADEYHWRDGIGPREDRPVRINTHWGWVEEDNSIGTHEFMQLVEMLDSEAYIAGNIGSAPPVDMAQWLQYMTADDNSTLAKERRANGREEPWKVAFWGVGNETWGCGGNMTPAYYTDLYRRYATFLKAPSGYMPKLVASGGQNDATDWTEALSGGTTDAGMFFKIDGISHHYYTLPTGDWGKKGQATGFPEAEWISTLDRTLMVDGHLNLQEEVLERNDPDGQVGIYLDEWGTWYDPTPGSTQGFLEQQNSIRDALVAALNFNVFHEHTERLHMANIAQTVNVLQAVLLTDGPKMIKTPTYHAFELYIPFQDATYLPLELDGVPDYEVGDVSVPHVSATAALTTDGKLAIGLVNLHASDAIDIDIDLEGFSADAAEARVLTGASIDAHNTFDSPETVKPTGLDVNLDGDSLEVSLPPRSVSVILLDP
ncbi:alpha-N-arabinofuranosidase [Marinihelvus fidelis]|nr:alpha-L-arabinofuranosidase C-terminal domain-containing protein [Marinihelvus fidelis]